VEEFHVSCYWSALNLNSWHRMLPNLRSICIRFFSGSATWNTQSLAYILTYFPRLTNLDLRVQRARPGTGQYGQDVDFWDTLTGKAARPSSTEVLLHGAVGTNVPPVNPIDGVYQVPSLGNLRGELGIQISLTFSVATYISYYVCSV